MAIKPEDFHYYFAIDKGDYLKFQEHFDGADILVSFVYLTEKKDKSGKFRDLIAKHNGRVMIDSGGFTNFTTPGTVKFEEWIEFAKDANEWASEYVQFDDLSSRPNSLRLYHKALSEGVKPLFVDHLWFDTHDHEVLKTWASEEKLCMSGFAKTLPGQRPFPGNPRQKLLDRFGHGRTLNTFNHLLAVGSLRKFMADLDRVHSVDSAAWDKSAAFGKVLIATTDRLGGPDGIDAPVLKAYDHPAARVKRRPMPPDVLRQYKRDVIDGGASKTTVPQQAKTVSILNTRRYIEALRKFNPEPLRELRKRAAEEGSVVKKALWDLGGTVSDIPEDTRVPQFSSAAAELDKALDASLASVITRTVKAPQLALSDDEFSRFDVEKAKDPWLTYYFACSPADLRKYFDDGKQDILMSFAHFVKPGKGIVDKRIPWDQLRAVKKSGRRLMLDSGAFTNFNKPDAVRFEEYMEFLSDSSTKELFDEYVMFDNLRDRKETVSNYTKMLEGGHDPLFVDHLWHDNDDAGEMIWKSRDKLCLSGFATTLPTQERFPGDPKARLTEAMIKGRDKETQVHLLAVSSMRRFLKFADRVNSVDSTAWVKASVYSMYLQVDYVEKNGLTIPVQKVWDQPGSGRKKPRFAKRSELAQTKRRVREIQKEYGCPERQAWVRYSIEQARIYSAALNAIDPKKIVEATDPDSVSKGLDELVAERGRGFAFIDSGWGVRDAPQTEITKSDDYSVAFDEGYRASSRTNDELVADWQAIQKLWEHQRSGQGEVAESADLIGLAVAICKEAVGRGPEAIVFDPPSMSVHGQELWGAVNRAVQPPADMVSKEVVTPNTAFAGRPPDQLLAQHTELHSIALRVASSRKSADWTWDELVDAHGRLVDALAAQGYEHPPEMGLLDGDSKPFEGPPAAKALEPDYEPLVQALEKADSIIAEIDPDRVVKRKALSGSSRPLEAVAVEEMIVEAGPPAEWSGAVAAILGLERRKRIQAFWRKASSTTKHRLRQMFYERMDSKSPLTKAEGKYDHIDFRPSAGMRAAAKNGLERNADGEGGDGLVDKTIRRARKIASGEELSPEHVRQMNAWFARHGTERHEPGTPWYTAWQLWGGDAGRSWASARVRQMDAADDAVSKAITSGDATKAPPARYSTHLHYRGNRVDMLIRTQTRANGELETWRVPLGALDFSVTSMTKAKSALDEGSVPLPTRGEIRVFEKGSMVPSSWLDTQGTFSPGSYGAAGLRTPGVFHRIEHGTVEKQTSDGMVTFTLTPSEPEEMLRVVKLRLIPVTAQHAKDEAISKVVRQQFDADNLTDLVAKLALEDGGEGTWMGRFELQPRDGVIKRASQEEGEPSGEMLILKAEKRLVTGIVLQPEVVDAQNDVISEQEIEQAAHQFLARFNESTKMGLMHKVFGNVGIDLVESWVAPVPLEIGSKRVKKGTWIMTVKVVDDELWKMVKSGKLTGFSIGGVASSSKT